MTDPLCIILDATIQMRGRKTVESTGSAEIYERIIMSVADVNS
jgi:hypothetical protein